MMWRRRRRAEPEVQTSRVIRPGEPPEWVSVVHRNGAISEVKIDGDNGELGVRISKAVGIDLHLSGFS
jgi:glutathione synthase/RimK-type ligase-like ATP-grasp enzyme